MADEDLAPTRTKITTRRQVLAGTAIAIATLATSPAVASGMSAQTMSERPSTLEEQKLTALHVTFDLKATPKRVYEALLSSKQFAAFSGLPATIDPAEGGAFSMFQGQIVGRTIELVPYTRIIQAWRPTSWQPGDYSIVEFDFTPKGTGTVLDIDHKGFTVGDYAHLFSGWQEHYVEPLKKFFA